MVTAIAHPTATFAFLRTQCRAVADHVPSLAKPRRWQAEGTAEPGPVCVCSASGKADVRRCTRAKRHPRETGWAFETRGSAARMYISIQGRMEWNYPVTSLCVTSLAVTQTMGVEGRE